MRYDIYNEAAADRWAEEQAEIEWAEEQAKLYGWESLEA